MERGASSVGMYLEAVRRMRLMGFSESCIRNFERGITEMTPLDGDKAARGRRIYPLDETARQLAERLSPRFLVFHVLLESCPPPKRYVLLAVENEPDTWKTGCIPCGGARYCRTKREKREALYGEMNGMPRQAFPSGVYPGGACRHMCLVFSEGKKELQSFVFVPNGRGSLHRFRREAELVNGKITLPG